MRIRVDNLPYHTTSRELHEYFSRFGIVAKAQVSFDAVTRKSKGFAFIEMPNDHEAIDAIDATQGKVVDGRVIKAKEAPRYEGSDGRFGARGTHWKD